jgi:hypothetical protein
MENNNDKTQSNNAGNLRPSLDPILRQSNATNYARPRHTQQMSNGSHLSKYFDPTLSE